MDRAGAQLDLLGRAVDEELAGFDPRGQPRVEPEDAVDPQHVGDEVVGEGGEAVEVAELGEPGAGDIGGGDLGALEERDLALFIYGDVGEGLPAGEQVGERRGRSGGRVEHRGEAAAVVGLDVGADVAERRGEVGHQRVARVLAERRRRSRGSRTRSSAAVQRPARGSARSGRRRP